MALAVTSPPANEGNKGWENSLEKAMATHSSNRAWRIPWTEEPGRLYSPQGRKVLMELDLLVCGTFNLNVWTFYEDENHILTSRE